MFFHDEEKLPVLVSILQSDITEQPADYLMTAVNSSKAWFGGIDAVIMNSCGSVYHKTLSNALDVRPDLQVLCVPRAPLFSQVPMAAKFNGVIFTIDDLEESLETVVTRGLQAANKAGAEVVSMPTIRFGVMEWFDSEDSKIRDIVAALNAAADLPNQSIQEVKLFVYRNERLARKFFDAFQGGVCDACLV